MLQSKKVQHKTFHLLKWKYLYSLELCTRCHFQFKSWILGTECGRCECKRTSCLVMFQTKIPFFSSLSLGKIWIFSYLCQSTDNKCFNFGGFVSPIWSIVYVHKQFTWKIVHSFICCACVQMKHRWNETNVFFCSVRWLCVCVHLTGSTVTKHTNATMNGRATKWIYVCVWLWRWFVLNFGIWNNSVFRHPWIIHVKCHTVWTRPALAAASAPRLAQWNRIKC